MFQFPALASHNLCIQLWIIQESRGHNLFASSPRLIADFHALHRLLMPRHPPCALSNLIVWIKLSIYEILILLVARYSNLCLSTKCY